MGGRESGEAEQGLCQGTGQGAFQQIQLPADTTTEWSQLTTQTRVIFLKFLSLKIVLSTSGTVNY